MKNFFTKALIILSITSIIGIILILFLFNFIPDFLSSTTHDEEATITIHPGASLVNTAQTLEDKGIIRNQLWFRFIGSRNNLDTSIRPGTYQIPIDTDIFTIYQIFQQGEPDEQILVTIPEGYTIYRMANRFEESGLFTKDEFLEALDEYKYQNNMEIENEDDLFFPLEGYLFPDTYSFNERQTAIEVIDIMVKRMDNVFEEEYSDITEEKGLSKHEILTIASLIERETSFNEESAKISGVIYNRLDINQLLQIDASVIYGVGEGRKHLSTVLYRDLESESPFNTYKFNGIPPGPIASPGRNSIMSALNPENHNYYYYVLGENGHVFAETYNEHLKNVDAYRQMQKNN